MGVVFCVIKWMVKNMKISCDLILAGCQPYEHDDIILDFVLVSVVLPLTLR